MQFPPLKTSHPDIFLSTFFLNTHNVCFLSELYITFHNLNKQCTIIVTYILTLASWKVAKTMKVFKLNNNKHILNIFNFCVNLVVFVVHIVLFCIICSFTF
jgi:hypothetical protein